MCHCPDGRPCEHNAEWGHPCERDEQGEYVCERLREPSNAELERMIVQRRIDEAVNRRA